MRITRSFIFAFVAGLTVLFGAAGPSVAVPIFNVSTETFSNHVEVQQFTDSSPVSALVDTGTLAIPAGIATMAGGASASPGELSARGSGALSVLNPGLGGFTAGTVGRARFVLDDIVISGPGITVSTLLHLNVDGSLGGTVNTVHGPGGFLGAVGRSSSVELSGGIFAVTHTTFSGSVTASRQVGNCGLAAGGGCEESGNFVASGLFAGFIGDAMDVDLSTPVFDVLVGVPFTLDMTLAATGSASYLISGTFGGGDNSLSSDGHSNFAHTVSFPTAGPVFDLPAGFTANSVSGLIVDNQWTGGAVTGVPEPASLALLGIGLAGFVAVRRRKTT